jgi:outer membrane receptor protein involved in Fe transport
MPISFRILASGFVIAAAFALFSGTARAQVTTATLYGVVQDSSGAILPGVNVVVIHQGTNLTRETVSDARGEFALPALPVGPYAIKIELAGFKTYESRGLTLSAGQTVRQTYSLEVGNLAETVTVAEAAPLIQTSSTAQVQAISEVTEIPVARRNLQNVVMLAPGVSSGDRAEGGGRAFRVNGVGDGGSSVNVDGSNAQAGMENRGMGNHGAHNQIEMMSVEAVAEVQVVRGVLNAEYGGSIGGQVNMITRSGTNQFHGSVVENFQHDAFSSRDPFLPSTTAKPEIRFNQFGASLGGPILQNRLLFFATYEGYRENSGVTRQTNTPTQATRDRILAALPYPETRMVLDLLPLPNTPIDAVTGRYVDAKRLIRRDNTFLGKVDFETGRGRLSVTASRIRPYARDPSALNGNDNTFYNASKRVSTQYVFTSAQWVSESRFGWNNSTFDRYPEFWVKESPTRGPQSVLSSAEKRIGSVSVSGLFSTPNTELVQMNYNSFNLDQKVTRIMAGHAVKLGVRWSREYGSKTNPQANGFTYNNLDDLLANRASAFLLAMGNPPHTAWLDQIGGFIQDDWRVNRRLVLNLGLRYDIYPQFQYRATTDQGAEINNLMDPTDIRKMDFGALRDPHDVVESDLLNFAPRFGFAWTVDQSGGTVVRGGVGIFTTSHLLAQFQNAVAPPFYPVRQGWNATEIAARGVAWPMYPEDTVAIAIRDQAGRKTQYYMFQNDIKAPETVQATLDVQRQIGRKIMVSAGYVHTDGKNFPMVRNFANAFDRVTGERPNPAVTPGGWYITSTQTMKYDAFETTFRANQMGGLETSLHYTLSKGSAQQGGSLVGNFNSSLGDAYFQTQDFFDPDVDMSPLTDEARHRIIGSAIYQFPWLADRRDVAGTLLGGWQLSGVISMRSGEPMRINQPSGIGNSRPDYNGGNQVFDDWRDTLQYLDRSAYDLVPIAPISRATVRPGTQNPSQLNAPGRRRVDLTIAKSFTLRGRTQLQVRMESFNAFNWRQYNDPVNTITAANFGRITGVSATRTGQVGFRLTF